MENDINREINIEQVEFGIDIDNIEYSIEINPRDTFAIELNEQGPQGEKGDAATITVGTTTTGLPGTNASVINSGTSSDAIFDFTIPRGDKGEQGIQGIQGEQGPIGPTGNGIDNISLISTVGLQKTYRITYTDGTHYDYIVTDGADGASTFADITGSPYDNTALSDALDAKQDKLTAGTDISIGQHPGGTYTVSGTNSVTLSSPYSLSYVKTYGACSQSGTPTPSSPVDIVCNNGAIKYGQHGKNLFDINNAVRISRATSTEIPLDETPTITIGNNGFVLGTPYHLYYADYMIAFAGQTDTQYTLSVKQMASVDEVGFAFIYSDGTVSRTRYQDTTLTYRTYTSNANKTVVGFALDYGNGAQTLTLQDIQIELGTAATSFEPYYFGLYTDGTQETLTITPSGDTATCERLLSIDDYTDVQDVISGTVIRNIGIKVLDGTENWVYNSSQYPTFSLQLSGANGNLTAVPCTHFAGHSGTWAAMPDGFVMLHGTNLGFRYDNITSLNDWKQWLVSQYNNGTPVIIVYPLASATTESVTPQSLSIASETNTISVTQSSINNLSLNAQYVTAGDGNLYIDFTNDTGYQTATQVSNAIIASIVDNTSTASTNKSLSANMGKVLQDEIDNLKARGRFLALWNCSTGLAESNPQTSPYTYSTGDYFIIGTVSNGTNYRPDGASYTIGVASSVVETQDVAVDDVYYYDGTNWRLQINSGKSVSFASIAGQPEDNANLASALNAKQDKFVAGHDVEFYYASKNLFNQADSRVAREGVLQPDGSYYLSLASVIGIWTLENIVPFNGKLGTTYTISLKYKTTDTAIGVGFHYSDGTNDIGTRGGGDNNWYTSYVTSNPAKQVDGFGLAYGSNLPVYLKDIQIELGSTPTPYISYYDGELTLGANVPTVGNGIVTFTQGGVNKGSISMNQGGNTTIALDAGGASRNIGEIVASTIPLTDAGLHLLDGALIQGSGSYSAFVDYIAGLVTDYPDLFETEANWQTAVTTYGVCGKFVYDSVANTVRLPKITGILEGTTDVTALGDLVEAGLPNITGAFNGNQLYDRGNNMTQQEQPVATGAFEVGGSSSKGTPSSNPDYQQWGFNFDASRSSSIYGNSSTVQPQTIKVLYYIVIATSTKTSIEVDIDEIATDLNGKADRDGSNMVASVKNFDGQWVESYAILSSAKNVGSYTLDLSSYLPNDGYDYEVSLWLNVGSTANTGLWVGTVASPATNVGSGLIIGANTLNSSYWNSNGTGILPVTSLRVLYSEITPSNATSSAEVKAMGYRRIGTNQ